MNRMSDKARTTIFNISYRLDKLSACSPFYVALFILLVQLLLCGSTQAVNQQYDITELSIEELMSIEIKTTISRKPQAVNKVPAAVFVITQEDIRRSGATSIPEALRMVPGLEVSKIDANRWTIASRGFNNYYSNKLLVLVDGRTVYTSLFSGVYWEVQDTVLGDIERIEVIRGPGGTLWGANAVNGVINIVTKRARDTQGGHIDIIAGTEERAIGSLRYGGKAGEKAWYRVYAKYLKRDSSASFSGGERPDTMEISRAGGKMELEVSDRDSLLVQGDYYNGESGARNIRTLPYDPYFEKINSIEDKSGWNIQTRWDHSYSERSDFNLQIYYHMNERDNPGLYEREAVYDLDFQHRIKLGKIQEILWGTGYRHVNNKTRGSFDISFIPPERTDHLYSLFIQDEFTIFPERFNATIGTKFEKNSYTGKEIQPSLRLMWTPDSMNSVWGAVSRAVRTPSRFEHDVRTNYLFSMEGYDPFYFAIVGNRDTKSELLWAYEAGYRFKPRDSFLIDITLFFNRYERLVTYEFGQSFFEGEPPYLVITESAANNMKGNTCGGELTVDYSPLSFLHFKGAYSYLRFDLEDPVTLGYYSRFYEGASPSHRFSVRSSIDLPYNLEMDLWFKYRDNLSSHSLPSIFNMDARIGYRLSKDIDISITGQNLLDSKQPETVVNDSIYIASKIERGYYLRFTWNF